jgi:HEAT repeat protein
VEPLIAALQDKDSDVRQAVAKALGELGDSGTAKPPFAAVQDEDSDVRQAAAEAAVGPLIAALWDEDMDVRLAAAVALKRIGEPAIERLTDALFRALQVRGGAMGGPVCEALGLIGDPRAVGPLIAALRDETGTVRWAAALALERIGTPGALDALEELWRRRT